MFCSHPHLKQNKEICSNGQGTDDRRTKLTHYVGQDSMKRSRKKRSRRRKKTTIILAVLVLIYFFDILVVLVLGIKKLTKSKKEIQPENLKKITSSNRLEEKELYSSNASSSLGSRCAYLKKIQNI